MSKTQMIVLGGCVLAVAAVLASAPATPAAATRAYSRPHRQPARPLSHRPLSQKEIDEIMAFVKEHAPEAHERLAKLLETNPRRAQPLLRRMQWLFHSVREYPPKVRAAAVGRQKLNPSIFKTVGRIRRTTDPDEKKRLTKQLHRLVGERFDNDQIVKEYEVVSLEKRLADLKAELERRRKDRGKIIDEMVQRMLSYGLRRPKGPAGPPDR